jgi:hypothetical protein
VPIDEPATADVIAWAAQRVMDMHSPPHEPSSGRPGRCAKCPPTGAEDCPALHEARLELGSYRLSHPLG